MLRPDDDGQICPGNEAMSILPDSEAMQNYKPFPRPLRPQAFDNRFQDSISWLFGMKISEKDLQRVLARLQVHPDRRENGVRM